MLIIVAFIIDDLNKIFYYLIIKFMMIIIKKIKKLFLFDYKFKTHL
jgi:hypothetical protein